MKEIAEQTIDKINSYVKEIDDICSRYDSEQSKLDALAKFIAGDSDCEVIITSGDVTGKANEKSLPIRE